MKKNYILRFAFVFIFLSVYCIVSSQNLIVNPSAESEPTSNGWTAAQDLASDCYTSSGWHIEGNQSGFPAAQSGNYMFYPGCENTNPNGTYELYQDIDVSSNALAIDADAYSVSFSGYMSSYNQTPPDETEMIVEYRDGSGSVIDAYATGTKSHTSGWVQYTDTRKAPSGTRTIRVRLIGTLKTGPSVDSYFDNLSLTGTSTLPVHFISFDVKLSAGASLLNWQTSDEINNSGFYVERSTNGVTWESVAFVEAAKGTGGLHSYQFSDVAPAAGVNYYRLKQVDLDGKYAYSVIKNLTFQSARRTYVFPNPVENQLNIVTKEGQFKAQILNTDGRVVSTFVNRKQIDLQSLPSGIYHLRILYNDRIENLRFMKR